MELYNVLNGFSRDFIKEPWKILLRPFSLNDSFKSRTAESVKNGTFTGIFSTKDMGAYAKKLRIINNSQISH